VGAAAVAAVMRRREREVVDDFRAAGAVSRETAQSYTAVGLGESLGLKRLRDRAVIREQLRVRTTSTRKCGQQCREPGAGSRRSFS